MGSTSGGVPRSQASRNLSSVLSSSGRGKDASQEEAERSEVVDTLHQLGGWKWSKVFPYERISRLHFTVGLMSLTSLLSCQGEFHYDLDRKASFISVPPLITQTLKR